MNLFDVITNFLLITVLGLLIAFSPMLVVVNLIVVLKSSRPILRSLVLMAGMIAPLLIVVLFSLWLVKPDSTISFHSIHQTIKIPPLLNAVFGLWLLVVATRRWRYSRLHHGPKRPASLIMQNPPDTLGALFFFAFAKSMLSVTNIFAVLVLAKLIVTQSTNDFLALFAILWVLAIGLLPFGITLYYYFVRHEQLEQLSDQVDRMLNRDVDSAINLILACIGAAFFFGGLIQL